MEELQLPNGAIVNVEVLAEAGNISLSMAKTFLLKLSKSAPMRKISLEEQLDRAVTYEQVDQFVRRLCKQDPTKMRLFNQAVQKMLNLSLADLGRATTLDEIRSIHERNIPGEDSALGLEVVRRLAEFFIVEK